MVVVKIGDGMGNQLFNYACGYSVARRDNDTLMLDTSECDNSTLRKFELDNFHLKYDARESYPNKTIWQKLYKRLRRGIRYHVIKEREVYANIGKRYTTEDIDPRVFRKKRLRNKYLQGYWQHLPYFENYLDEIRTMMTPSCEQSERVKELIQEFQKMPTCAVHVRGGDIGGPEAEFFEKALLFMESKKKGLRYIIFTNDRERAETLLGQRKLEFISQFGEFSDVDEFFLMAACQNQILSNSTYSTWAAYLNSNEEKTVIMPKDKLSERMRLKDWIIL